MKDKFDGNWSNIKSEGAVLTQEMIENLFERMSQVPPPFPCATGPHLVAPWMIKAKAGYCIYCCRSFSEKDFDNLIRK